MFQWYASELRGAGDLRLYASVQAYSVLFLCWRCCFRRVIRAGADLAVVAGFYVLAKLLETFDKEIFRVLRVVSGHTLKHLAAAFAAYWILRMLQRRRRVGSPELWLVDTV